MCISRLQPIGDMCITQPYVPTLFEQGEPLGPDLLLRFLRDEVPLADLGKGWTALQYASRKDRPRFPDNMPLYCRGCSAAANQDVYRAAKQFTYADHKDLWTQVISQGMERFCTKCSAKRNKSEAMEEAPAHQSAKAELCAWCNKNQRARQGSAGSND